MTKATMPVVHACVMSGLVMRCWLACPADNLDRIQIVLSALQLAGYISALFASPFTNLVVHVWETECVQSMVQYVCSVSSKHFVSLAQVSFAVMVLSLPQATGIFGLFLVLVIVLMCWCETSRSSSTYYDAEVHSSMLCVASV